MTEKLERIVLDKEDASAFSDIGAFGATTEGSESQDSTEATDSKVDEQPSGDVSAEKADQAGTSEDVTNAENNTGEAQSEDSEFEIIENEDPT